MLLHTLLAVAPLLHSDPRVTTEPIEPLRAVPRDAFVVLQCASLDLMRADAARNAWSQFLHDESMAGAWKELESLHAKIAKHEPSLDPKKILESIHGRIAGFARAGEEGALQFGFVIEPGAQHAEFDAALAGLIGRVGAEFERTTADRAGVELAFYAKPATSAAPAKRHHDPDQFATFAVGGYTVCLCGTDHENLLELADGMVDRIHGSDPSGGIDSSAALADARKTAGSNGRVECFVDLATVLSKFAHKEKQPAEAQKLLDAFGVNDLRWAHASADFGAGEDLDLSIEVKLPAKGAIANWVQCLKPYNAQFAAALPRDALKISLTNLDVYGLWKSVWTTMGELEPAKTAQVRKSIDSESKLLGGVDLEKDIVSQITGDFAEFDIQVPAGEWKASAMIPGEVGDAKTKAKIDSLGTVGGAFLIGLRDSSAVEALVEKLLGMVGMEEKLDSEEIAGTEVHFVEMPMGKVSWCFVDQGACISVYPTAMKALLEHLAAKGSPSALDNARFQPVLAQNKDAAFVSVCGTPESLKLMGTAINAMRSVGRTMHSRDADSDEDSDDDSSDVFDAPSWPSAAVIDRYFKGTMVSTVRLKDGALRVNFSTR